MLSQISLLRNIGQFDSVTPGAQNPFSKFTLIYAENGRGKTTLAAILRSLSTGEPAPIVERHRLRAANPPHVILTGSNGGNVIFENGAWSRSIPEIAVFDDIFVDENVCSGLDIETVHRQNLHELVLGAQGVALSKSYQGHVDRIEEHNSALRTKADAIPAAARGTLSVDDFCALKKQDDIDDAISEANRNLLAAREVEPICLTKLFVTFALPDLEVTSVATLLARDLEQLEAAAAAQVQSHLKTIGTGGETWVGDGISRIISNDQAGEHGICPFCAQDMSASSVIAHYRAYFSAEYNNLKKAISAAIADISTAHGSSAIAAFERAVGGAIQTQQFWSKFANIPAIEVDTAAVSQAWGKAFDLTLNALKAKLASPLEKITLPAEASAAITDYIATRDEIMVLSDSLTGCNPQIELVKEKAAVANIATLEADLTRLQRIKGRYSLDIAALCEDYVNEQLAKVRTSEKRDQARKALENYRKTVFPAYEQEVNAYLPRFTAGFRLDKVMSANTRGGSACTYNVLINNVPVPAGAANATGPSFRNTLSAGDRNTLALAFFFASLALDQQRQQKIVIFDDPMCSLDEHRTLSTRQQMLKLLSEVEQVIVLSHSKPFLCGLWENADKNVRGALKIARAGSGSTLEVWDVHQDCVTEHDKRHSIVTQYILTSSKADERKVASALRPILESFFRVAYPQHFAPGSMIGKFIKTCRQNVGTVDEILSTNDITELDCLREYGNKFHHDTNAAWETELINDTELADFCKRTLNFARRT